MILTDLSSTISPLVIKIGLNFGFQRTFLSSTVTKSVDKFCILDSNGHDLEDGDLQDLLQLLVKADSSCYFVQHKVQQHVSIPFPFLETSANGTGKGYEILEMDSYVVNSTFTVASLLVGKDAWFASCCKKEQLDKRSST